VRARRLVGTSLSVILAATVLVTVGVGKPGGAQASRVRKQSDPGNSEKDVKDRGVPPKPVVGTPQNLEGINENPKGDDKSPDWFLKTDDASRKAAIEAQRSLQSKGQGSAGGIVPCLGL
jgi:hypothetical protein